MALNPNKVRAVQSCLLQLFIFILYNTNRRLRIFGTIKNVQLHASRGFGEPTWGAVTDYRIFMSKEGNMLSIMPVK